MSDNHIDAVREPGGNVIKGSNFPTPMAMAPNQTPSDDSGDSQPQGEDSSDAED